MNAHPEFTWVDRSFGGCWLHKSNSIWIVEYDAVAPTFYCAYYVPGIPPTTVGRPPEGRDPWTVNNYTVKPQPKRGYATFDLAVEACLKQLARKT